jgi:hypothetical protein
MGRRSDVGMYVTMKPRGRVPEAMMALRATYLVALHGCGTRGGRDLSRAAFAKSDGHGRACRGNELGMLVSSAAGRKLGGRWVACALLSKLENKGKVLVVLLGISNSSRISVDECFFQGNT